MNRLYTILIFTSLSNVWKLGEGVETLTCSSSNSIQVGSSMAKFRFGDGITPYDKLLSCSWTITASDSSASLVIGQTLKCGSGDQLSITDASGTENQITCCDDCTKNPIVAGNTSTIKFSSDGTQNPNDIGFDLDMFAAEDESSCTTTNNVMTVPITPSPRIITSPNFPSLYPTDIECNYTFSPPPNQGLVILFEFINLDYDRQCFDKIILMEGDTTIAEICKDYPTSMPVLSPNETYRTTGELFLHFKSDGGFQARGFRAIIRRFEGNTESTTTMATESTTESTTQSTTAESTLTITSGSTTTSTQITTPTTSNPVSQDTTEGTTSTQHLSTVVRESSTSTEYSTTTSESTTSTEYSTTTLESTTTPKQPTTTSTTTTVPTTTDLSYLERLGFTPTTFTAMTVGVSFLVLATVGLCVLLVFTIRRTNKSKKRIKKKHTKKEIHKKSFGGNYMYNHDNISVEFHKNNRRPLFYSYW